MTDFKKAAIQLFVLMMIAVVAVLIGCGKDPMDTEDVKKAVYDQLSQTEQNMIAGTWESGEISEFVFDGFGIYLPTDGSKDKENDYIGKNVYRVFFRTNSSGLLGDIDVIADMYTGKILGHIPFE